MHHYDIIMLPDTIAKYPTSVAFPSNATWPCFIWSHMCSPTSHASPVCFTSFADRIQMHIPQLSLPQKSLTTYIYISQLKVAAELDALQRTQCSDSVSGLDSTGCCDLCCCTENSWISCIQNHLKMKCDTILSAEISPKRLCLKSNWIWKGFNEMVQLDFLTGELNDWIDRRINRPLRDCTC